MLYFLIYIYHMKYSLIQTIKNYLTDAGFTIGDYILDNKEKKYIEVFFLTSKAVYFIIDDVLLSDYKDILEIKDYKYGNGNITAIITFID